MCGGCKRRWAIGVSMIKSSLERCSERDSRYNKQAGSEEGRDCWA